MIAISMRIVQHVYPNGAYEIRDALAHDWYRFLAQALPNVVLLPIPNRKQKILSTLCYQPVTGVILTGGDGWGVFPARDATETYLAQWAQCASVPILGVCRGAQVLNQLMGGRTSLHLSGHVGTRHKILFRKSIKTLEKYETETHDVNSYHRDGLWQADLSPNAQVWATADDGSVEAFSGDHGRVVGIMWHPEREKPAQLHDILLFQQHFK